MIRGKSSLMKNASLKKLSRRLARLSSASAKQAPSPPPSKPDKKIRKKTKKKRRRKRNRVPSFSHKKTKKSSTYIGVSWYKSANAWKAQIHSQGTDFYLGRFETEVEAALAYDAKCLEIRGKKAKLNFSTIPGSSA